MRHTIKARPRYALVLLLISLPVAMSCSSSSSGHHSDRSAVQGERTSGNVTTAGANPAASPAPNPAADPAADPAAVPGASPAAPGALSIDPVVTPANVGGNEVNALVVHVGVRNFQAINYTMSTLTGIPTTNAAVAATYADQNSALPTETDVKSFVGSSQVAVFKLAVEYCNALMTDNTKATAFFGATNINDTPANVFTAAGTKAISETLITKLWGANLSTLPPLDQSSGILSQLIKDLLTGKDNGNKAVTTGVLVGACTTVLGAAPVTIY